ncbi:hypothetical protein VZ95_20560 [Elstera litoralis]|uniref:Flagellar biosynthesis regulatory protein FlaF n=1 Tax=Elstera litoralis TaxID=552518 RepID=A0A0F3IJR5_9PROT|nr:flagellar biosynthesis regulator FlaF [Elstera litoralis]KJV06763.1 hypothetical protein VZ95_20560 [Elstera litoralis]
MIQAAKRLDDASKLSDDKDSLLAAVRLNWKLWTIIQADILDDTSLLSLEVRQSLLDLSNFIDKHSVGIIAAPDVGKLPVLVDINKNIAAGLFDSLRNPSEDQPAAVDGSPDEAPVGNAEKISTSA